MSAVTLTRPQFLKELAKVMPPPRRNLDIAILTDGVRRDEEWWYVPVKVVGVNGTSVPLGVYVNLLAAAEVRAYDELGLNVLFVPTPG